MQIYSHIENNETASVTVRLSREEALSLRQYMHTADGARVAFPHGVHLLYRSMGWYRLDASNSFRASEKLKLAISIVRKWHREFEAARLQEIRLLMLKAKPELAVVGYVNNEYLIRNAKDNTVKTAAETYKVPPSPDKLQALTQRFSR
jgi:hypothetical protein